MTISTTNLTKSEKNHDCWFFYQYSCAQIYELTLIQRGEREWRDEQQDESYRFASDEDS